MTYDVHIFAVVRVKISGVEAESQMAAIRTAVDRADLDHRFDGEATEYAEEITRYMVDEVGDTEYARTQTYLDLHHLQQNDQDIEQGAGIVDLTEG